MIFCHVFLVYSIVLLQRLVCSEIQPLKAASALNKISCRLSLKTFIFMFWRDLYRPITGCHNIEWDKKEASTVHNWNSWQPTPSNRPKQFARFLSYFNFTLSAHFLVNHTSAQNGGTCRRTLLDDWKCVLSANDSRTAADRLEANSDIARSAADWLNVFIITSDKPHLKLQSMYW